MGRESTMYTIGIKIDSDRPEFADYFESQNAAIKAGTVKGDNVNLVALGVNNGWFDPILQYQAYITYSYNNSYKPIISTSQYNSYTSTYNSKCLPALKQCTGETGTNSACESAENTCYNGIEGPLSEAADFDVSISCLYIRSFL